MINVRTINPRSEEEIALVADQMQKTLIDVMGAEKGEHYYSKEWLLERVQYHINLKDNASIFLAIEDGNIAGQAIVRTENDNSVEYGFFSTIYVNPDYREKGVATDLTNEVIEWCAKKDLPYVIYNTASDNKKMTDLLVKFGFQLFLKDGGMVQLKREIK